MPLILGANTLTAGGYEVDNSLRFNDGSSDYLNRTPGSAGNRKTFTYSGWVKRSALGGNKALFSAQAWPTTPWFQIQFEDNKLRVGVYDTTYEILLVTTPVYRDVSAWYHVVVAVDTTQATSSNRVKLYVNGVQVTSFDNEIYPSLNYDTAVNNTVAHYIGDHPVLGYYYDGYMAEVNLIDGQALTPTDFGEFDEDSGIWKPIAYEGTYGTNGFYLEFKDSSALGDDTSNNSNDFTVNNLTSIDQTTDTPTNNFATWNALAYNTTYNASALEEGNTRGYGRATTSTSEPVVSTFGASLGKYYFECKIGAVGARSYVGISSIDYSFRGNVDVQYTPYAIVLQNNGTLASNNTANYTAPTETSSWGSSYTTNDIIGVAMDLNDSKFYISINGTWQNSADPSTGTNGVSLTSNVNYTFIVGGFSSPNFYANFGNPPFTISSGNSDANGYGNFEYAVPSGYFALNTKNLSTEG